MFIKQGSYCIDYDANSNPLYEGWTKHKGSCSCDCVWKIRKYLWACVGTAYVMQQETWANGNELYNNQWCCRCSCTYT